MKRRHLALLFHKRRHLAARAVMKRRPLATLYHEKTTFSHAISGKDDIKASFLVVP